MTRNPAARGFRLATGAETFNATSLCRGGEQCEEGNGGDEEFYWVSEDGEVVCNGCLPGWLETLAEQEAEDCYLLVHGDDGWPPIFNRESEA